ncbi:hypothetical protein DRH14_04880 [Candidatus Shapirobacteria bacterium]|nr:MAG: hypothetical protein DRH14_04880 [Candidatus Shapirobacteria bacterium]
MKIIDSLLGRFCSVFHDDLVIQGYLIGYTSSMHNGIGTLIIKDKNGRLHYVRKWRVIKFPKD